MSSAQLAGRLVISRSEALDRVTYLVGIDLSIRAALHCSRVAFYRSRSACPLQLHFIYAFLLRAQHYICCVCFSLEERGWPTMQTLLSALQRLHERRRK